MRGDLVVTTDNGFLRLAFRFAQEVETKAEVSGAILVISFKKSVAVAVDRINSNAPDYISAARRDPDGTAIRLALVRPLKVNTIAAAERVYIDLMPETWKGMLPGLPIEVVDELSRRAREAERQLHHQQLADKQKKVQLRRVKVANQPTFVRYVFDLPDATNVVPETSEGKLTLNFDQQIKWDFADAKAALPASLELIDADTDFDSVAVVFTFNGTPNVRTFREDRSIVVDVSRDGAKPKEPQQQAAKGATPAIETPDTVPAREIPADEQSARLPTPPPPLVDAPAPSAAAPPKAKIPAAAAQPEVSPASAPPKVVELPMPPTSGHARRATVPDIIATKPIVAARAPQPPGQMVPAAPPLQIAAAPTPAPAQPSPPIIAPVQTAPVSAPAQKPVAPAAAAQPAAVAPPPAEDTPALASPAPTAPVQQPAQQPVQAVRPAPAASGNDVVAVLRRDGDTLRVEFPFAQPTPAAVFQRGESLWLVFDSAAKIDLGQLLVDTRDLIRSATVSYGDDGEAIVRIRLQRPRLASFDVDGPGWMLTLADSVVMPTKPLGVARNIAGKGRASIAIPFDDARKVHRLSDAEIGDRLLVITALGPARGFLKPQEFVELRALPSVHGVVVQPIADDVAAEVAVDKITITRPGGLSLSSSAIGVQQIAPAFRTATFDTQLWGFDREAKFSDRQSELIRTAAAAPESKRRAARLNLARFYLARDFASEAKAVIDVALSDQRSSDDITGSVLQGRRRSDARPARRRAQGPRQSQHRQSAGRADLARHRLFAAGQMARGARRRSRTSKPRWARCRSSCSGWRCAKRCARRSRCAISPARPTSSANSRRSVFRPTCRPSSTCWKAVCTKALADPRTRSTATAPPPTPPTAAPPRKGICAKSCCFMPPATCPAKIPFTSWRRSPRSGAATKPKSKALKILAHLYTEDGRYREAFHVMRTAMMAHPNSDLTRKIQDEAAATFDSLFLAGKGDAMPPIEALGLFYDFRELTPIGRRGDEMIRRLADRLVGGRSARSGGRTAAASGR